LLLASFLAMIGISRSVFFKKHLVVMGDNELALTSLPIASELAEQGTRSHDR